VSYAIGVAKPLSVMVFSYGTSELSEKELLEVVNQNFDLRPGVIMKQLALARPIYERTAENGHFGHANFPWEQARTLQLSEAVQAKLGMIRQEAKTKGISPLAVSASMNGGRAKGIAH
jgi:S-adenosylmethionine synthetase